MLQNLMRFVQTVCLTGVLLLGACSKDKAPQEAPADQKGELMARLASADAADGTTDKIVSKCSTCALRMDGKAENELKLEGYTLHFCSASCKETCEKDPMKVLPKV
jgi:YHS domain-containing protein